MYFEAFQKIDLKRKNPVYRYEQPMEYGDDRALQWIVAILDDRKKVDLTGLSAKCFVTRPANAAEKAKGVTIVTMEQDAVADVEQGTVSCLFDKGCYAGVGVMVCVMRIYDSAGSVLSAAKMTANLERNTSDAFYDTNGLVPSVDSLIAQANAAAERAEAAARRAENAAGGGGSGEGGGGVYFETDETLKLEDGILSVNTADVVEEDNTLPITSAAVYETVGNINALLATI